MADFKWYLNRQGVRGAKGDKGEKGFSPVITEKENTKESYVLHIQNETDDTSFDTPNLKEGLVPEDLGGTYVKLNRDTGRQYYGNIDEGTNTIKGVVRFATDVEASNGEEVTAAVTPDQVAASYTTKATTNKLSADLTALTTQEQNDVIALDKRITTNETNISSMRADINSIASDSASLKNSNRFTGTNTFTGKVNIAGAPLEVDGVSTLNQVTATYLNAINITSSGEINAVSVKANGLRSDDIQTTENKKYLTELDVDNQTIQVVNGKLHANLDELGNEVNDLSGRVTTNEADISTMKTSLSMKQTKLTAGTNITLTDLSDGTVKIDSTGGGGSGATIDDSTTATTSVWSSSKTNTEITTVANEVAQVQGDVTSLDGDVSTLKTDVSGLKTDVPTLKVDVSGLKTDVSRLKTSKQNMLVSGTNIKTINGETILGEGNITVGGSTPTNMVTVDTDQTITGKKVFLQPNSSNKGLNVALGSDATNPDISVHIGKGTNSDFTGGMIRFDSTNPTIVGLQQQNTGGTMKIVSSGDLINYATGTTEIRNGATWSTSKSGIRIPANSKSNPKIEIIGGSNTVGSSDGVDAKISVGREGIGAWGERKGVFIKTSATQNADDSGAKLWLGEENWRSAIYPVTSPTVGRCLNFETYVGDNSNATLSIQKSDVVYTDSKGVAHSLISGNGVNTDLSNLSDTGKNNLVDNNCYDFDNPTNITVDVSGTSYTMPVTGLLLCSANSTEADSNYIQIQNSNQENLSIIRAPLANSSITNSIRVKKGQNIIIKYNSINNLTIKVYPCFLSSGG